MAPAVEQLDWAALADVAATCQACSLCAGRKHSTLQVPEAAAQADWFFVGDPPDEDEDQSGHAFAGQTTHHCADRGAHSQAVVPARGA